MPKEHFVKMAEHGKADHPSVTHPVPTEDQRVNTPKQLNYPANFKHADVKKCVAPQQTDATDGAEAEYEVGDIGPMLALEKLGSLNVQPSTSAADTTLLAVDKNMVENPVENVKSLTADFLEEWDKSYPTLESTREDMKKHFIHKVTGIIAVSKEPTLDAWKELWKPIVRRVVDEQLEFSWMKVLRKRIDEVYYNDQNHWNLVNVEFLHVALSILYNDEANCITSANLEHYANIYEHLLLQVNPELVSEAMLQGDRECLLSSIAFNSNQGDIIKYLTTDTFSKPERNSQPHVSLMQGKSKKLIRELNSGSIAQPIIRLLNNLIKMYVTPDGKDGARKHAFVCYNIKGRENDDDVIKMTLQQPESEAYDVDPLYDEEGKQLKEKKELEEAKGSLCKAEREADTVIWWLRDANFIYDGIRDWTVGELSTQLEVHVKQIKDECSVLVVFLMAHGELDYVEDVNGRKISLNELDDIINGAIPDYIPKIFIVQACQVVKPAVSKRAPKSDPWWKQVRGAALNMAESVTGRAGAAQPVEQTREVGNTKHFVRVMAAAEGQKAYRNEFLPLLIEQLKEGLDFLKAFDNTAKRLDSSTPEIKKKTLVNPVYLDKGARC